MWNSCWGWGHGFMGGGMVMMFIWFLFFVLVVVAIVLLVIRLIKSNSSVGSKPGENALEILKRRYASGEINSDEYAKILKDITIEKTGGDKNDFDRN
jgi:putative membrane protein